jgi:glycosyltransferase involved in cell wall biosynthesis
MLEQSFTNFELIIVDDCSSDRSSEIIQSFDDQRISYIRLDKNSGNYSARNAGIRMARGKYICMMDADDISLPGRLHKQVQYLEKHKNIGCVGALSEVINEEGLKMGFINRPLPYPLLKVALLKDNYVTQSTLMVRAGLLMKHNLKYNESFRYSGDYDFVVRLAEKFAVCNLNEILVQYRIHPAQISTAKRPEQVTVADFVRKEQLQQLGVSFNEQELALHLQLMKGGYIEDDDLINCEKWLNKLYESNSEKSVYNDKCLFKFFQEILDQAVRSNLTRKPLIHSA